jgi:hypothetical protein
LGDVVDAYIGLGLVWRYVLDSLFPLLEIPPSVDVLGSEDHLLSFFLDPCVYLNVVLFGASVAFLLILDCMAWLGG